MRDYSFGNFLHELRLRRGLTQYQLGALVGVSDKAVSKWENGSSKPQSSILCKLGEILGISVDELLSCKYHSFEKKNAKGAFAMKKQLWNKAFDAMCELYGGIVPIEISNRFLTEQAEIQNTDMIVYFDMLATLTTEARKSHKHIRIRGGTGASFVAYLLGATKINPLKPHYYCTDCRTVVFDNRTDDGWDLPQRQCSCGKTMVADGHNIPFETYRHIVHRNTSFDVSMSPGFIGSAKSIIEDYFKDCKLIFTEREENHIITIAVSSEKSECTITLCANTEIERYQALECATATSFDRVWFYQNDVLREFKNGNTYGITEFKSDFVKNLLNTIRPNSFRDLIQILGFSHGTGGWLNNADYLVEQGLCAGKMIAYRDDVFNYIQEKMIEKKFAGTGFAYKVMEDTRRGVYTKNGVPDDIRTQLKEIGMEEWFVNSISKIKYLFPKAHGVTSMELAATLMWYKIQYPKEFNEIIL